MCVEIAWPMKMLYRLSCSFIRRLVPEPEFQSFLSIVVFVVSILPPLNIEIPASLMDSRGDSDPCRSDIFSPALFERLAFPIPESDLGDSFTQVNIPLVGAESLLMQILYNG